MDLTKLIDVKFDVVYTYRRMVTVAREKKSLSLNELLEDQTLVREGESFAKKLVNLKS